MKYNQYLGGMAAQLVIRFHKASDRSDRSDRPQVIAMHPSPSAASPCRGRAALFCLLFQLEARFASVRVRESTPANCTSAKKLERTCALFYIIAAERRVVDALSLKEV